MSRIAQKIPQEEAQKDQPSFTDWSQRWKGRWQDLKDLGGFMKSVWNNPYEFDVNWHEENARRRQRDRGKRLNWLQWARLSPQLRKLYNRR